MTSLSIPKEDSLIIMDRIKTFDATTVALSDRLHSQSTMIATMQVAIETLSRMIEELRVENSTIERNIRSIDRIVSSKKTCLARYQSLYAEYSRTFDRILSLICSLEKVYPEPYIKFPIFPMKENIQIGLYP